MGRRKPLPQEPVTASVERFTHDGRGVAYVDGKAVFIEGALPGEMVRFQYTDVRRNHACGKVLEVLVEVPGRTPPSILPRLLSNKPYCWNSSAASAKSSR